MISDRVVRWFQSVVSGRGSLDRVKGLTRPGGFLEWSVLWISVWRNSSVVVVMRGRDRGGVQGGGGVSYTAVGDVLGMEYSGLS